MQRPENVQRLQHHQRQCALQDIHLFLHIAYWVSYRKNYTSPLGKQQDDDKWFEIVIAINGDNLLDVETPERECRSRAARGVAPIVSTMLFGTMPRYPALRRDVVATSLREPEVHFDFGQDLDRHAIQQCWPVQPLTHRVDCRRRQKSGSALDAKTLNRAVAA